MADNKTSLTDYWEQSLTRDALDLINRQQAEIERLKELLDEEEKKYNLCAKRFYKEGVKEFAERLKPMYKALCVDEGDWYNELDNLVKEMAGE